VVVMLTSLANRQTIEECLRLGAASYIRKDTPKEPYSPNSRRRQRKPRKTLNHDARPSPAPAPEGRPQVSEVRYSLAELLGKSKWNAGSLPFPWRRSIRSRSRKCSPTAAAMPATKNKRFVDLIRKVPGFSFAEELKALVDRHGPDTRSCCRPSSRPGCSARRSLPAMANALGFAYVDPFASIVTEEAVEKLPHEIARKTRSIVCMLLKTFSPSRWPARGRGARAAPGPDRAAADQPDVRFAAGDRGCDRHPLFERQGHWREPQRPGTPGSVQSSGVLPGAARRLAESTSLIQCSFDHLLRHPGAGDGHPHRAWRTAIAHPLPRRWHAARGVDLLPQTPRALISRLKILCSINITESRFRRMAVSPWPWRGHDHFRSR